MAVKNLSRHIPPRVPFRHVTSESRDEKSLAPSMLLSQRALQVSLGGLWFLDGVLQLFPSMWTSHLADVMAPVTAGQPGPLAAVLQPGVTLASQHIIVTNGLITIVQLSLGICLLLNLRVREALWASVAWSLIVWIGGEGMGMLLTGQAGALTGAPGAVLLYALLALFALPRGESDGDLVARHLLQRGLALFWALAALLQLQPYWWQRGQIAGAIAANKQPGTLSGSLLDGSIGWAAGMVGNAEPVANVAFVAVGVVLAVGLAVTGGSKVRYLLVISMVLSIGMWWATQGFGLILTGGSTDVNSGPLLFLCALACWPRIDHSTQPQVYIRPALAIEG